MNSIYKKNALKLSLVFFLITILFLYLLFLYGSSIAFSGFLIILAVGIVLFPIFMVKDVFHPFILLALSSLLTLINFIDHTINNIPLRYAKGFTVEFSNYAIQYSMIVFIVWYISFYIGFTLVKELRMKNRGGIFPIIRNPTLIATVLLIISLISFMAIVNLQGGINGMISSMIDTTNAYSGLGYFRYLVSLGGIGSLLLLLANKKKLALIVMLVTCLMLSFFGGRGAIVLGTILPFLMVYNYKVKKIKPLFLFIVAFIGLIFVVVWEQMRRFSTINLTSIPITDLITSVAENTRMADILPSLVGQLLNGNIDFQWGKPLINIFYSPIPRAIWEGKPEIIDETVLVGSLLLGDQGYYGLPAGPYGWAFLNFSWVGVIIFGFITGYLVKKIYIGFVIRTTSNKESFIRVIIYSLIIRSLFDIFATSSQIGIIWIISVLLLIYIIDFFLENLLKKYKFSSN